MTVTFETGDFTAYALAYAVTAGAAVTGTQTNGKTDPAAPKTDDPLTDYLPLLAVYVIALLAGAGYLVTKKRNG